ncbi:adenosine deaminase [Megachile rotundata]|uniref:adenosine deaminase n=1 Tax=Megachile rotundata TaxID=143995 RepID=UPI003FD5F0C2
MKKFIFLLIASLVLATTNSLPSRNYTALRQELLDYEQRLMIGSHLKLNDVEEVANKIIMKAKRQELDVDFKNPYLYTPGRNFLLAKNDIQQSKVFKLLRMLPKGAALHAHDTAIGSFDYLYHNITFRDNLYICGNGTQMRLQFFRKPDQTCNWELLKKVREDPSREAIINESIMSRLWMSSTDPMKDYSDVNKAWIKFMDIFRFIHPVLTYRPVFEDYFLDALKHLHKDNVMYLELRSTFPTLYELDGRKYKPEDLAGIYRNLTERFKKEHPDFFGVKVIYAPNRSGDLKTAEGYIKIMKRLRKLYPDFVIGFDLVGQEDKGHTLQYFADVIKSTDPDVRFFFHAGETNWLGASTDENLVDAILLNTQRIGHGYALVSHPFLLKMVKELNIAVEVNPISNQILKLVDDLRNHPAKILFAEGYPVVISNDDPGFWGAEGLSHDFYEAFMALMSAHADLRALKQLAMNSIDYSSMNEDEKKRAFAMWQQKWDSSMEAVASNEI